MKLLLAGLFLSSIFLTGCASTVKVQPVSAKDFNIDNLCIEKNPDAKVEDFLSVLQSALQRHQINSEVFDAEIPDNCQYRMSYKIRHSWDVSPYLSYIMLNIFNGNEMIASAVYEYSGSTFSPDLTKWSDTASKIDPLIEQLFVEFCLEECQN